MLWTGQGLGHSGLGSESFLRYYVSYPFQDPSFNFSLSFLLRWGRDWPVALGGSREGNLNSAWRVIHNDGGVRGRQRLEAGGQDLRRES